MFTMNVPKYLWENVILTAPYLINHLPSRTINFNTTYLLLKKTYPHMHSNDLPLKTFGCTTFVHIHSKERSKLDPRAIKTIFLGYSSTNKGYRCFCPQIKKSFTSRDVTLLENVPYLSPTVTLQGESNTQNEAQMWQWRLDVPINITTSETVNKQNNPELRETEPQNNILEIVKPLQVYSRKNKTMNTQHDQESNPVVESRESDSGNPIDPTETGLNTSTESDLNVPIAIWKGKRITHPIERFVSYSNLSSSFDALTTSLSNIKLPKNINEALNIPQ
ncbi:hypothetical protein LIER_25582 [Lithospermum erythrorhizon]|uniref:Retroviral polymerase SH3-like domain-containing protein n=1 Tax=Lithospermum erythrorhizon TaxID=34254 RepID=A0AAV3R9M4_LITER